MVSRSWLCPALLASSSAMVTALACSSADSSLCVEPQASDCQPLYEPTFEEVFARTLVPRCAIGGGSCHGGAGSQGDLRMDSLDETYRRLVDEGRVVPGDASCSLLSTRLEGGGRGLMPPGAILSEAERCAVETWIERGASR